MKVKHILAVIVLLALLMAGFAAKLFWIGEPVDGVQLHCSTSVEGQTLTLNASVEDSAMALRDLQSHREGDIWLVSARKVLVSPFCSSDSIQTTLNLEGIQQVRLGGQIVWIAEN